MVKGFFNCRLEKAKIEYIKQTAKNLNVTQSKIISDALHFHKLENRFYLELPRKKARLFADVYNNIIPLAFGALSAFMFFQKNFLFLIFGCIAITPILLKIEKTDINKLVVGL